MAIKSTTVKAGNIVMTGPQGQSTTGNFVSFDSATGDGIYQYPRTWTYLDNGTWRYASSASEPVTDEAGNPVVAATPGGELTVNIPVPTDTTPPTMTPKTVSPATITTAGDQTITVTVTYADAV